MQRKHNRDLLPFARHLRKNMTPEERHLWYDFLSLYPIRFARQKILGKYIVDFYCAQAKLVIEIDGSQHYEEDALLKDAERTHFLKEYGLTVLRFTNEDIHKNFRGVCDTIDLAVQTSLESAKSESPPGASLGSVDKPNR